MPPKNSPHKNRLAYLKRKLKESDDQKEKRLPKRRNTRDVEPDKQREIRLQKIRENERKKRVTKTDDNVINQNSGQTDINHDKYLTPLMEQKQDLQNIDLFHKSNKYLVKQCTIFMEVWPSVGSRKNCTASEYKCP